jgi:hypothetical protein
MEEKMNITLQKIQNFVARRFSNSVSFGLVLLMVLVILAACGGASSEPEMLQSMADTVAVERAPAPEAPMEEAMSGGDYDDESGMAVDDILANAVSAAQQPRIIIYTGDIALVVKNTRDSVKAITALATEKGGYVSNSNIYQYNDVPRGSISIRIPAEMYAETLVALREMSIRVERENTGTQDVTEEFTDLQARKTNLEFTEAALQTLLDERQRVGSTSDILEVHRELTNIRGQVEQIEGRMRYLANQSALSTITVELTPDVLYQPVSIAGWEPQGVAKEAVQALVAAMQGLVNLLIWLIIFVLPLLIIFLIPVVFVIWLGRTFWKRSKGKKQPTAAAPAKAKTPPADKTK